MPPPRGTPNPLEGPGDYDVTPTVHSDTYPAISPLLLPATNQSVFIAGASRGVGLAMAISFAQSGASQIALGARSPLTAQKEKVIAAAVKAGRPEPNVLLVVLNISDQKSTQDAAQLVEKEFGKLDVLLINAGIIGTPAPIADSEPEVWWNTLATNFKGPYLISRAFLQLLLKGGDKTIVTTSSVGAHITTAGMSAYQISKTAATRLMDFVSAEYADKGVVAFSIHPGNIVTDMVNDFPGGLPESMVPVFVDTVELTADTVAFLTREHRSWLGGRYVNCTWDMPELIAKKDEIVKDNKLKFTLAI